MFARKSGHYNQGNYTPKNPSKYVGDPAKITYRSSWELSVNRFLDNNVRVLKWGSEIVAIPYIKPTDGKMHKYYVDYWVEYIDNNGEIHQELIEVKPIEQTKMPTKNRKHILHEKLTYAVNCAKWEACKKWCDQRGMKFRIITAESIFR